MKKNLICALVCLSLCLPSALAAEPGFLDVSQDDWFAPYIQVCTEKGLMNGVGEGQFAPQRELSQAECLALAARLHELQNGGDSVLPEAPADWGRLTLTTADGKETAGFLSAAAPESRGRASSSATPAKPTPGRRPSGSETTRRSGPKPWINRAPPSPWRVRPTPA